MPHYGLLGEYRFREATDDIRGTTLYGVNDEKLGKIEDVIFDHSNGDVAYLVVDTGGWLSTKKFVVPADRVRPSSRHDNDFVCELTKQQVEAFPTYQEEDLDSEERWAHYEEKYRSEWKTTPVMHRAETDRNITPTTQQLQGNPVSTQAAGIEPKPLSVVIENTAVGIGGRWDTFQARLRERRKEAVVGCRTCKAGPGTIAGSESASTLKKAI